jgi:hypothetical protein
VEYYAHSEVGVGILSLPFLVTHEKHMFRFGLWFLRGEALGWGILGKCRVGLSYCPVLKLLFGECQHPRASSNSYFGNATILGLYGANMGQECRQL